jgi:hypothetical protein
MVVIADLDHGVALIPEGMEVPRGMAVLGRDGKALPFVHAPESAFTDARDLIAATALPADLPRFVTRDPKARTGGHPRASADRFHAAIDNTDNTYYVTFYDGSYIAARRIVTDVSPNGMDYAVATSAYSPSGDYYSGWCYAEQSSSDHPGYNASAYTTINSSGGIAFPGIYSYQTSDPYFSAHVTSSGNVHHHWLPICGHYGEPPCNENLSGSVEIYFP